MQGHNEVDKDARMLKEKLERLREARRLTDRQRNSGVANRDAGVLTRKQSPASQASTLVEKLECYRVARELRLKNEQQEGGIEPVRKAEWSI